MTETIWLAAWLVWIVPLAGAILTPSFSRLEERKMGLLVVIPSLISALLATYLLLTTIPGSKSYDLQVPWFYSIKAGVLIDPLSAILGAAVAWVSFLIMVYSIDYMHNEEGLARYWFFMNFFIGSMLLIVYSDNLLQLFFGWEGVGLCSYALIGHYYGDEKDRWVGREGDVALGVPQAASPTHAGMKAFITTRFADLLTLSSIFMIYFYSGTFNFRELAANTSWASSLHASNLLLPAMLLMLGGALGKSAQFPFHEWLPDAMTGPTPVSALIHAATMVKAGVFFVARIAPIFFLLPFPEVRYFFVFLATIGALTAAIAAVQGIVNKEIKKILAYSTVSQIGYMMLALGIAGLAPSFTEAYAASLFQLLSHMMFKAGLFMAAGVLIHMTGSYSVDGMGGLKTYARRTFYAFVILALALAGVPPLSGFFSKDLIFAATLSSQLSFAVASVYVLSSLTAIATAFYSLRMTGLVFFGKAPKEFHGDARIRQFSTYASLAAMTVLLGLLAPLFENFLFSSMSSTLRGFNLNIPTPSFALQPVAVATSLSVMAIGIVVAYPFYISRTWDAAKAVSSSVASALYRFVWERLYINAIYYRLFVNTSIWFGQKLTDYIENSFFQKVNLPVSSASVAFASVSDFFDRKIVDGFMNGVAYFFSIVSRGVRKLQTGNAESYLFAVVFGLLFLLLLLYHFMGLI
ncbi:MAG: NADH-quinone oxidoreductase subunit L [Conexivisphaerales archaeon]